MNCLHTDFSFGPSKIADRVILRVLYYWYGGCQFDSLWAYTIRALGNAQIPCKAVCICKLWSLVFCSLWESLLVYPRLCRALCWSWQQYGNVINPQLAKKTFICLILQKGKPQWKAKNLQLLYDANICIILQRTYYRWNKYMFAIKEKEWNEMKVSLNTSEPWKLEPFYRNGLHIVQVLFCCRD